MRWRGLVGLVAVALALLLPAAGTAEADDGLSRTPVSFTSADGTVLHGELIARPGTARRPALVMVGGAGPVTVAELRPAAEAYARHGIPTLVYDKRTAGYSTTHRDYGRLADDALAALGSLRSRPEVDPARVGLWGLSEGAWVVSQAAGRSTAVSFVITAGAVGLTPARQQAWAYGGFLHHAGVSGSLLPTMQVTVIRQLVAAGLFPEADYDPVPAWRQVQQPVLAEWGTLDREAAPAESEQIIRQALDQGGNRHYTLRTVPGVRHNLQRTFADGYDRPTALPADYADYESAWIDRLATGLPPATADPAPRQDGTSRPLAPLSWESPWLQVAAATLCLTGFTCALLSDALRRLGPRAEGRAGAAGDERHASEARSGGAGSRAAGGKAAVSRTAELPRAGRWAALAGAAATLGTVGYLLFLAVTAAGITGPVLLGRPVVWLALQLLAVLTVAGVCATAVTALRRPLARRARARLGLLLVSGTVFVPWALYWGLLQP